MSKYLRVTNWDKWQSYRQDRGQPPWIKLHRSLLRNPKWIVLSDADKAHLVSIWILAADRHGLVPNDALMLQKLCYLDSEPDIDKLMAQGFLSVATKNYEKTTEKLRKESDEGRVYFIEYEGAIKIGFSKNPSSRIKELAVGMPNDPTMLGTIKGNKDMEKSLHEKYKDQRINREWYKPSPELIQEATGRLRDAYVTPTKCLRDGSETETETEKKQKRTTAGRSATQPFIDQIKAVYPKRSGSQPWQRAIKACNARMKEGVTLEAMISGAKRYAAWCDSQGKTGTELVMQAATFFGPDWHFDNPWEEPKTNGQLTEKFIRDHAKPGETWDQAKMRLNQERASTQARVIQ